MTVRTILLFAGLALSAPAIAAERVLPLRVCADPGNMPFSNNKGEGFENKISEVLAKAMGTRVTYFWRPYLERGLTRQTFDSADCDVLMDLPAGYERALTTFPIYRTTYVLAHRNDSGIKIENLDDPKLKQLRVGVFQHSGLREALARHGVKKNVVIHVISHDADLRPERQPWRQVQQVIDGELDIAAVWGPFAGFLKKMKDAPLVIQPVNLMEDAVPMEFDLALGMRKTDTRLKRDIEQALTKEKDAIHKILLDYGVPLVRCEKCLISGDLPSHGPYDHRLRADKRSETGQDNEVTRPQTEEWLASGADINQELNNAVLSVDAERVQFLLEKGADINARDLQGFTPLINAARNGRSQMVAFLIERKADVHAKDSDGWTAVLHAVLRNDGQSIRTLAKSGADLEALSPGGFTPLSLAIGDGKTEAAKALIESGVKLNHGVGKAKQTPLMLAIGGVAASVELSKLLIARGADVNATNASGETALMVAALDNRAEIAKLLIESGANVAAKNAQGKTALTIARDNKADAVIALLEKQTAPKSDAARSQN
ncbi:MAG: quinoprotein dehydrogenase-associated putative ABC transporter substrate-binding protein [Burkholderiales bacterium]